MSVLMGCPQVAAPRSRVLARLTSLAQIREPVRSLNLVKKGFLSPGTKQTLRNNEVSVKRVLTVLHFFNAKVFNAYLLTIVFSFKFLFIQ